MTAPENHARAKRYDVFTFFNELDLLKLRLNILNEHVDHFVIIEATETFSGRPKPLVFAEHRERFAAFNHKIIHHVTDDTPADADELRRRLAHPVLSALDRQIIERTLTTDNVKPGVLHWLKEFYQKEAIQRALVGLSDEDVCFVSDVDEIWNPNARIDFSRDDIYKLRQTVYAYYLNNRSNEPWAGTLVTRYKHIKHACLNHLRTASKTPYTYVENGGWHFTNQGGAERVREKIEASYGPEDLNTVDVTSKIQERIEKNTDYVGRQFKFWVDETDLPQYILEHRREYKNFFAPTKHGRHRQLPDTIVVKLQGGIGNQLFQYALGQSLIHQTQHSVQYDRSWFATQTKRKFELGSFAFDVPIAPVAEITEFQKYEKRSSKLSFLHNVLTANEHIYIKEKSLRFNPAILQLNPPVYLDGNWQSEKYFQPIADQLRTEMRVRTAPVGENARMLAALARQRAIAVHVRRGDYVQDTRTNTFHGVTSMQFYQTAAAYLINKTQEPVFYVFSDDSEWVKTHIHFPAPTVYVDHNDTDHGYEDLRLMRACRHHIIANSSFSWWGAWLAETPGQIVIAPKQWFNDPAQDSRDLVPDRWVRM